MASITLTNIVKKFGSHRAVDRLSLDIREGEFLSFLGGSGCGKTTTLRMIAGLEYADEGTIQIGGEDMNDAPAEKRRIGMVFQNYALFPNLTVDENIGYGLRLAKLPKSARLERVEEMLELIALKDFGKRYPHQLSGGQQQRVALARALAIKPRVLLLDEPLSALDAQIRGKLGEELRSIQRKLKITTVYVTHDQAEALALSDRIAVMNEGRIEQLGTPWEIYHKPASAFVASFIGTLNLLPAHRNGSVHPVLEDGQKLKLTIPPEWQQGSFACRPEALQIIADGADPDNMVSFSATVEECYFLGAVFRLKLTLGASTIFVDLLNEREKVAIAPGTAVRLGVPLNEAQLV